MFKKAKTLIAAFVILSFLGGVVPARAVDRDDRKCEEQIRKAEAKLHDAERKHGEHSRQAESKRRDLENVRARCHRGDHDRDHDHDHERR
jgi:ABC-type nickel/cobalt efflux system permease component RcnA